MLQTVAQDLTWDTSGVDLQVPDSQLFALLFLIREKLLLYDYLRLSCSDCSFVGEVGGYKPRSSSIYQLGPELTEPLPASLVQETREAGSRGHIGRGLGWAGCCWQKQAVYTRKMDSEKPVF